MKTDLCDYEIKAMFQRRFMSEDASKRIYENIREKMEKTKVRGYRNNMLRVIAIYSTCTAAFLLFCLFVLPVINLPGSPAASGNTTGQETVVQQNEYSPLYHKLYNRLTLNKRNITRVMSTAGKYAADELTTEEFESLMAAYRDVHYGNGNDSMAPLYRSLMQTYNAYLNGGKFLTEFLETADQLILADTGIQTQAGKEMLKDFREELTMSWIQTRAASLKGNELLDIRDVPPEICCGFADLYRWSPAYMIASNPVTGPVVAYYMEYMRVNRGSFEGYPEDVLLFPVTLFDPDSIHDEGHEETVYQKLQLYLTTEYASYMSDDERIGLTVRYYGREPGDILEKETVIGLLENNGYTVYREAPNLPEDHVMIILTKAEVASGKLFNMDWDDPYLVNGPAESEFTLNMLETDQCIDIEVLKEIDSYWYDRNTTN